MAATWKSHAPTATSMPIANQRERKSAAPDRSGCFQSTSGAAHAPRCFSKKPRFVASAQAIARRIPSCTVIPLERRNYFPAVIRAIGPVACRLEGPLYAAGTKLVQFVFPLGRKTNRRVIRAQQDSDKRPILFVDVDGVVSLFGFSPGEGVPGQFHSIDGIIHCIGHEAGRRLLELAHRY